MMDPIRDVWNDDDDDDDRSIAVDDDVVEIIDHPSLSYSPMMMVRCFHRHQK